MSNLLTKSIRTYYAGPSSQFVFRKSLTPSFPENMESAHLYIHVPFCRHACPYCPYNKIDFQETLAEEYFRALRLEIDLYYHQLSSIAVGSVYFGGGSPSILPEKITEIIHHLRRRFKINGEVCIELNPKDCEKDRLKALKEAGINVVSVGVQSFDEKLLSVIGRKYNRQTAEKALEKVQGLFDTINVDLMFALSGQEERHIESDIEKAVASGATQITSYPLFTFPYTSVGRYRKISKVEMPGLRQRKRQYYAIYDKLTVDDFRQVSVWSFQRGQGNKYSSVTRDGYIGFGAGAGSHFPEAYCINTFSVPAYIDALKSGRYPTALTFEMNDLLNSLYWLYWRFYDSQIPVAEFHSRFEGNRKISRLIALFLKTGLLSESGHAYLLTRKGSFWLHLAQNYFSLGYINKIWTASLQDAYPDRINF